MDRTLTRPKTRLAPAAWAALAIVTTVVAALAAGAQRNSTLPAVVGTSVTRIGTDVAGVACVGLALLGVLLPSAARVSDAGELARVRAMVDRALVGSGGTWLVLALLGIAFRAADGYGRPVTTLTGPDVLAWATALSAGRGALLMVGCAAAVLGCAIVRLSDPEAVALRIVLVIGLLGMITPGVTGHASSAASHEVAVTTIALHVATASLWVGGLAAILVLLGPRRELLQYALPRFSMLATYCLFTLTVSGVVSALVRVESWAALFSTGYGALIIAKTVALGGLSGLGLLTRRRMVAGRIPVLRWAGAEVTLMALTLGLAAALSQSAPSS